jgi:hypothetical protein
MATWKWTTAALEGLFSATAARRFDWVNDTFKVSLHTVTFVPDQDTLDFFDDCTNEVTGTGYTAGGVTVSGKTLSRDAASNETRLLMADNVWGPGATIAGVRVAVLRKDTGAAATSPVIGYLVEAADVAVSNGTLTVDNDPTAVLKITAS